MSVRNFTANFIILFLIFNTGCSGKQDNKSYTKNAGEGKAKLVFEKEMYNFGEIKKGDIIGKFIHFKNKGNGPLVINDIKTNCGCVEVKFSHEPIKPGDEGKLEVIFDSNGFYGRQVKFLKIFSNDPSTTEKELMIFATVM